MVTQNENMDTDTHTQKKSQFIKHLRKKTTQDSKNTTDNTKEQTPKDPSQPNTLHIKTGEFYIKPMVIPVRMVPIGSCI